MTAHTPTHRPSGAPRGVATVFARAALVTLLMIVGGSALSLPGRPLLGRYDFGYTLRGDRAARPAQVFDDGAGKVYFAPRPGEAMPAVFVGTPPELLVTQPEGQYYTAHTRASAFTLALGAARASARRGDAALGEELSADPVSAPARGPASTAAEPVHLASVGAGLPEGIVYGPRNDAPAGSPHEQPVLFPPGSARLAPEVRAALSALVPRLGTEGSVIVQGRDDEGGAGPLARSRAETLRNALLADGVAASRLSLRTDPALRPEAITPASTRTLASSLRWRSAAAPGQPLFDIFPTDADIAVSLRRWAAASGYQLAWEAPWAAPVEGSARLEAADFLGAVRQVVSGLREQGYPVRAQVGADRTVRFTSTE